MNYQKFVNIVKEEVAERFSQKEVEVVTVTKNNQISKVGLTFKNKTHNETIEASPTLYLEDLFYRYENGMIVLDEVVNEICTYYMESSSNNVGNYIERYSRRCNAEYRAVVSDCVQADG